MFDEIIGNEQIKKELKKSILENKVSHSYMFVGIEGIGKQMIAKEFAQMILCTSEQEKGCHQCKSCIEFMSHNHPDFLYLEPDGNSIKIEQIRYLQRKIQEKPIISDNKVYIINDADKMTTEAQNCLLKTLEEPPEYGTIILIGSNENAFLNTIKSRCMKITFQPVENEYIKQYMEKTYGMTNISQNMLEAFQGSIGKAILLKDKKEQYENIESMIEKLNKTDMTELMKLGEPLYQAKEEIMNILDYINIILLRLAKENIQYANCIDIIEDTKKRLNQNANYDMCIDNMIFNMWEEVN